MYPMSGTVDQLIGTTVRNYHITRLLGQGNLSVVYLAEQQTQRLPVMLTFFRISPEYSDNARDYFFARFSQVAGGLIHLNHPAILPTLNFGEYFSSPFLVTPYVEETSLTSVLRQQRRCTPEQTLNLLRQVASGLDHAHEQGVIHGTLRSANILLSNDQVVHMTGFGLAQMLAMRGISSTNRPEAHLLNINGSFLYSPEHIAPEIVRGAPPSALADVYALGILAFELLTGQLPFTGSDPFVIASQHLTQHVPSLLSLSSDVPAGLDLVIQKALERDPNERYPSAGRFVTAFARVLGVLEAATKPLATGPSARDVLGASMPPTSDWLYSDPGVDGQDPIFQSNRSGDPVAQPLPFLPPQWQDQQRATSEPLEAVRANTARQHAVRSPSRPARGRMSRRMALLATGVTVGALVGAGFILKQLRPPAPKSTVQGSVIGQQNQALNSAQPFTNPADKQGSLLIHLPDKRFVAYESACTHERVTVRYDSKTHMLVCPKHGSIFDPAKNGAVVKGPATRPLPPVSLHINADGTISAG